MNNLIKRGEIYYIRDTRQGIGSEQRADRPAVVVSNNKNNEHSGVFEVVYMTTQPKTDLPTHFNITSSLKPSTVLCEQINSVYMERIGEWIGTLTPDEMKQLDYCISVSVGIVDKNGIMEPLDDELIATKDKEVQKYKEEAVAAEKKAAAYKEMYDFLLAKRMEA